MSFKELPIMKDKSKGVLLFIHMFRKNQLVILKNLPVMAWKGPAVDKFEKDFKNNLQNAQ